MSKKTLTPAQAAELWSKLLGAFVDAEAAIVDIIVTEAWKPLGYKTFSEAWTARMKPSYLASEGLKHAVGWQMFKDGASDVEDSASATRTRSRKQVDNPFKHHQPPCLHVPVG